MFRLISFGDISLDILNGLDLLIERVSLLGILLRFGDILCDLRFSDLRFGDLRFGDRLFSDLRFGDLRFGD